MSSRRSYLLALGTLLAGCSTGGRESSPSTGPTTSKASESRVRWTTQATPEETTQPLPDETIEVEDRTLRHPSLRWSMQLSEPVLHPPAYDPATGRVYVGAGPNWLEPVEPDDPDPFGGVIGFDDADGSVAWRSVTRAPPVREPFVYDGRVHVVTASQSSRDRPRVVAFGRNGGRQWERTDLFTPKFLTGRDGTVFAGDSTDALRSSGRTLYALAPDGSLEWDSETGDAMGAQLVDGRLLYRAGMEAMAAYDPATGDRHWQREGQALREPGEPPLVEGGHCFVTPPELDDEGAVIARSIDTGAEQWRYEPPWTDNFVPTAIAALPEPADAAYSIVCTELGGTVFALDDSGSERWRFEIGRFLHEPIVTDSRAYATARDGTVFAFDLP